MHRDERGRTAPVVAGLGKDYMLKRDIKNFLVYSIGEPVTRIMSPHPHERFFLGWLARQHTFSSEFSPRNVYFEFGVSTGNSLVRFINAAKLYCKRFNLPLTDITIYAFELLHWLAQIRR